MVEKILKIQGLLFCNWLLDPVSKLKKGNWFFFSKIFSACNWHIQLFPYSTVFNSKFVQSFVKAGKRFTLLKLYWFLVQNQFWRMMWYQNYIQIYVLNRISLSKSILKFGHSEKATKIWNYLPLDLTFSRWETYPWDLPGRFTQEIYLKGLLWRVSFHL